MGDTTEETENEMTTPTPRTTAKARRAWQASEYGGWVAATDIRAPSGALAYAPGHPVPASNVDDDGRVVLARHQCNLDDGCVPVPGQRCELFNEPTVWTDEGAARRLEA